MNQKDGANPVMNSKKIYKANGLALLQRSALFAGFSETELLDLYPALQPVLRRYTKDSVVIDEGDAAGQIGFVASGRIASKKLTDSGRYHILAVHEAGDDVGFDAVFSSYKTSPLTFTAETYCKVLFVSTVCFFDQSSDVSARIMYNANRIMADRCARLLYKIDVLSKRSLRERIMTYFLIMRKKSESDSFSIKMTRQQFAEYLCVNRSALSRELGQMQRDGLIEMASDGQFTIKCKISWIPRAKTVNQQ
jgi:CRP-like cAMP-binding protein